MIWPPDRNKHQGRIVSAMYEQAADLPCERKAVMAGGLLGADKAAELAKAGIDPARYLRVSVGAILDELARRSLIPVVAGKSPLEAADLVHAEAQHVAGRLAARALADGRNVLLDITMASDASVKSWLRAMNLAAYTLDVVIADISGDEGARRADAAYRRRQVQYHQGTGHGGRYLPPEAIRAAAPAAQAVARSNWTAVIAHLSRRRAVQFPGSDAISLIRGYRDGQRTLDDLADQLRGRKWPAVPPMYPAALEQARPAIDDLEPWVPDSFGDVVLAYDLGLLSDSDYAALVRPPA